MSTNTATTPPATASLSRRGFFMKLGILFNGFAAGDRGTTLCGLECGDRMQALQRIFEHEMVHLLEWLCWAHSDCAAARFQDIASRFFLHRAHTHNLITSRERAENSGFRVGSRVTFTYEGRVLTGRVNRVTKRATECWSKIRKGYCIATACDTRLITCQYAHSARH